MNFLVLLAVAVLVSILLISLLTVEEWNTDGINTYFHHSFTLPDGATAGLGKFDDCIKFAVNSKSWEVLKLSYDGSVNAVETVQASGTFGMWKLQEPVGDFAIVIRKVGESQPYFLDITRDLTGKWSASISRF